MNFALVGRFAGAVALTATLAGCLDMTMDIEVTSETGGRATVTSVMGADIYPMIKAGAAQQQPGQETEGFCEEEGAVLTENPDGSATCVVVSEGSFADLDLDSGDGAKFEVVSPGVVRLAFDTADMEGGLAASTGAGGEELDAETRAMMQAFFEGHSLTLRVRGKRITDTNMTLSGNGTIAEQVIPFLDLLNGTAGLPDELYAVVDTN